jgi:hypothetical protein
MYERSDRDHVAWDIETTGFGWSEEITVSGLWFPDGHASLVVNAGPHAVDGDGFEEHLSEVCGAPVSVTVAEDETDLLGEMRQVVFERFDRDYNRLVAYNAESWKGGFDLPFVRTRCIRRGVNWVFEGIVFADLWEPVKKRLNTTHTAYGASDSANSLTGAYSLLFDRNDRLPGLFDEREGHAWYRDRPYDPFEDSGSAAARYREGDLLPVLEHNLADVHRTWELGELVREFVPSKDLSEKKL